MSNVDIVNVVESLVVPKRSRPFIPEFSPCLASDLIHPAPDPTTRNSSLKELLNDLITPSADQRSDD
jgi:hypothetical protein